MKRIIIIMAILFCTSILHAQSNSAEMADTMRSNGRIYVVVAVILTIFLGLLFYLVRLEKKLNRLEKLSTE